MGEFTDKVVLVTGAGGGIGRALAQAFAAEGARVAANDITPVNLDDTVAAIRAQGGQVIDMVFDVARQMPVQAMIDLILEQWGRIDVVINNAGVQPYASLLDMDEWDWRRTVDVNLNGPFFVIQAAGRVMRRQNEGVIVNIAATAGRVHGLKDCSAYVASKMGLIGLTHEAARELAAYQIRVNAVCPGQIATPRVLRRLTGEENCFIPLNHMGGAEDIVQMVLFLCSQKAAYITGQSIHVDGGQVML